MFFVSDLTNNFKLTLVIFLTLFKSVCSQPITIHISAVLSVALWDPEWRFWWMEHFLSLISSRTMLATTPAYQLMAYWPHHQPLHTWLWNVRVYSHIKNGIHMLPKKPTHCFIHLTLLCKNLLCYVCDQFLLLRSCTCGPNAPGNLLAYRNGGGHCLPCPGRSPCALCKLDQRWE